MKTTIFLVDGAHVERMVREVGPLLPVREAAALRGSSRRAIYDRLERGSVKRFVLFGHTLVGLREVMGAVK